MNVSTGTRSRCRSCTAVPAATPTSAPQGDLTAVAEGRLASQLRDCRVVQRLRRAADVSGLRGVVLTKHWSAVNLLLQLRDLRAGGRLPGATLSPRP